SSVRPVHYTGALPAAHTAPDPLTTSRVVVPRLQARLRDGTLTRVPDDGALPSLDLREPLERSSPIEVRLAVPVVQLGRANVGGSGDEGVRYRADSPRDGLFDENTGQNARPVQLRRLNLRLLASTQDPAGHAGLP